MRKRGNAGLSEKRNEFSVPVEFLSRSFASDRLMPFSRSFCSGSGYFEFLS